MWWKKDHLKLILNYCLVVHTWPPTVMRTRGEGDFLSITRAWDFFSSRKVRIMWPYKLVSLQSYWQTDILVAASRHMGWNSEEEGKTDGVEKQSDGRAPHTSPAGREQVMSVTTKLRKIRVSAVGKVIPSISLFIMARMSLVVWGWKKGAGHPIPHRWQPWRGLSFTLPEGRRMCLSQVTFSCCGSFRENSVDDLISYSLFSIVFILN